MKRLLIIAGSDTMGGAGLQADLKVAAALGIHATTVVTAVTSQNTKGVHNILNVPVEHISSQLCAIADDIGFDGVKIGMLGNKETAQCVYDFLKGCRKPVIIDPVVFAQSGGRLSDERIFDNLFSIAEVITPNAEEAQILTGKEIKNEEDLINIAKLLTKKAKNVLVKGGDTNLNIDVFSDGKETISFPIRRIYTNNTHGTGCSLASAIACYIIKGFKAKEAIEEARKFVRIALLGGYPLGSRFGTLDQLAFIKKELARYEALKNLYSAYQYMRGKGIGHLIPEIQSNLVYLLPYGENLLDVAGFPARITRYYDDIHTAFYPDFGVSKHMASVVLAANRYFPEIRSAMNIKFSEKILATLEKLSFNVTSFDRKREPKIIKEREGSSLDWGVSVACEKLKLAPDAIFDRGDIGKEPVIRIFGKNPEEVAKKVVRICKELKRC
ncbi:MAG: bifunctional hydroxymethylpyrimidine kinase/phosphomethylpyrimidine kinase [bacterium]